METEKVPKKSFRKTFRNIWLISTAAFIVLGIILFIASRFIKLSDASINILTNAVLWVFGIIGFVSCTSFLAWISDLIFHGKPFRLMDILFGLFISSRYALLTYGVTYIFVFRRVW